MGFSGYQMHQHLSFLAESWSLGNQLLDSLSGPPSWFTPELQQIFDEVLESTLTWALHQWTKPNSLKRYQATWEKILPSIHTLELKMPIKLYIKYTFCDLTIQIYIHSASNIHSHQIYIKMPIKMYVKYTSIYTHLQWQQKCTSNIINYYISLNVEVMTSSEDG